MTTRERVRNLLTQASAEETSSVTLDLATFRKLANTYLCFERQDLTRLRLANQELKDYAYIVSHDLRAPLLNIIGFAKDLEDDTPAMVKQLEPLLSHIPEQERPKVAEWFQNELPENLKLVRSNAQRMNVLITSLLELSRLGKRIPRIQTIELGALVRQILAGFAHQIESKQIETQLGELPCIDADETYLTTILTNLLSNAVKYTPAASQGRIEIRGNWDDDEVTLSIGDNGRGIASDDLDKIFLPFRRVGVRDSEGEGMGLAYVQMAVRQCEGSLKLTTHLGEGSCFQVTLPRKADRNLQRAERSLP